jgi:uncharacterized protein (DUF697 family)
MTGKKLPKAITRPSEDLKDIAAAAVAAERPNRLAQLVPSRHLSGESTAARPSAPQNDAAVAEPVPAVSRLPVAAALLPVAPIDADPQAARRRSQAEKIVKRHTSYAAVGGLVPLPIANVAAGTAVIMRMVKKLSDLYEVPFERGRTRSLIIGLTGGAVPTGLAAATTSTLAYVVPGSAFVGLAVSSITAAAFTRGIGMVFVDHFENAAISLGAGAIGLEHERRQRPAPLSLPSKMMADAGHMASMSKPVLVQHAAADVDGHHLTRAI